jgi:hypothetical protein
MHLGSRAIVYAANLILFEILLFSLSIIKKKILLLLFIFEKGKKKHKNSRILKNV